MKRYLLFCQLAIFYAIDANAQFTVGSSGFFTKSGTDVYLQGLTLNPSSDLTLTDNTLTIFPTAIPGSPPSISRLYSFTNPFSFVGRVGLFYNDSELNGNDEDDLQVAYRNVNSVVTSGSVRNTTTNYVYNDLSAAATFSVVTAGQTGSLPVTLASFTAAKEGNVAQLAWSTSFETNSDYFEVQRSTDGKRFGVLDKVPAWTESQTLRRYSFTDKLPESGSNIYRLKMVDKDGTFAYSMLRNVEFNANLHTSFFPNPVVDKLQIKTKNWDDVAEVKLFNQNGRTLFNSKDMSTAREIDMKDFPSGLYIVQLRRLNGSIDAVKVIKQ